MDFIDNVDLILSLCWCKLSMVYNFTNIIHARITRCIYLDNINHRMIIKRDTIRTVMTWVTLRCDVGTVDSLCKDTRQCCFPDTMKSEKYISMVKCLSLARVRENFFYEFLSDNIREVFWSIGLVERHRGSIGKKL